MVDANRNFRLCDVTDAWSLIAILVLLDLDLVLGQVVHQVCIIAVGSVHPMGAGSRIGRAAGGPP